MSNEIITDDGEIIERIDGPPVLHDGSTVGVLARAELDAQIVTARTYPRSVRMAMDNIITYATLDEETAVECIYALKRSGKPIRGPSIRLAEILVNQWGNCRAQAMVVDTDRINKIITAEGIFHDLQTNSATRVRVQRRISDKNGRLFSDDMIVVTGNAACSIAKRNAVLAGIPKGVWRKALQACEEVIRGNVKTMSEQRDRALSALAHFGLSHDQVFALMEVGGLEDLTLDDISTLRVIYTSLKNGDQTVEDLMRSIEPEKPQRVTPLTAKAKAPDVFDTDGIPEATKSDAPADKKPEPKKAAKPPPSAPATALAMRRIIRRR